MNETEPSLFGLAVSTHRIPLSNLGSSLTGSSSSSDVDSAFPYEAAIAAVSIFFFRSTVRLHKTEPVVLRWFFCALLAALALLRKSYDLLAAVEIFSYVVSWLVILPLHAQQQQNSNTKKTLALRLLLVAGGAVVSLVLSHSIFTSGLFWRMVQQLTPAVVKQVFEYLFPVAEMSAANSLMYDLALEKPVYEQMIRHLFFVTFHIQVGMGYLGAFVVFGVVDSAFVSSRYRSAYAYASFYCINIFYIVIGIDFLREEQNRRNQLIRLDVAEDGTEKAPTINGTSESKVLDRSMRFQRGAAPFSM
jgi:hypothetical protein